MQIVPTFQVSQRRRSRWVLFDTYPLVVKARDYRLFRKVVKALRAKAHLEPEGFERVVRWAYAMNADGRQRRRTLDEVLRGSSETVREARSEYVAA